MNENQPTQAEQLAKYHEHLAEMGRMMQQSVDHASHAQLAFQTGNFDEFVNDQYKQATARMEEWYEQFQRTAGGIDGGSPDQQHATPSTG